MMNGLESGNMVINKVGKAKEKSPEPKYEFTSRTTNEEIKNIRLAPEQVEEINTDDYSLLIFNATRVEALSLAQVKKHYPEPTSKKAKHVLDRFVECGLVHITESGKYFSNYPDHYIDYSLYKYDAALESKKDSRIFDLMKDNCNSKSYWKDKSYFSEDGFFTEEQSREIAEDLNKIRLKVKKFTSENRKSKKVTDLIFRRFKYYDMILGLMLVLSFITTSFSSTAFAEGNDPGAALLSLAQMSSLKDLRTPNDFGKYNIKPLRTDDIVENLMRKGSLALVSGNDPGALRLLKSASLYKRETYDFQSFKKSELPEIKNPLDGGHDPGATKKKINIPGVKMYNKALDCGDQLEAARGSLGQISPLCLKAVVHSSIKECGESGDPAFCNSAEKGIDLTNKYKLLERDPFN